jgi:hypothetical protein
MLADRRAAHNFDGHMQRNGISHRYASFLTLAFIACQYHCRLREYGSNGELDWSKAYTVERVRGECSYHALCGSSSVKLEGKQQAQNNKCACLLFASRSGRYQIKAKNVAIHTKNIPYFRAKYTMSFPSPPSEAIMGLSVTNTTGKMKQEENALCPHSR